MYVAPDNTKDKESEVLCSHSQWSTKSSRYALIDWLHRTTFTSLTKTHLGGPEPRNACHEMVAIKASSWSTQDVKELNFCVCPGLEIGHGPTSACAPFRPDYTETQFLFISSPTANWTRLLSSFLISFIRGVSRLWEKEMIFSSFV